MKSRDSSRKTPGHDTPFHYAIVASFDRSPNKDARNAIAARGRRGNNLWLPRFTCQRVTDQPSETPRARERTTLTTAMNDTRPLRVLSSCFVLTFFLCIAAKRFLFRSMVMILLNFFYFSSDRLQNNKTEKSALKVVSSSYEVIRKSVWMFKQGDYRMVLYLIVEEEA